MSGFARELNSYILKKNKYDYSRQTEAQRNKGNKVTCSRSQLKTWYIQVSDC